MTIKTSVDKQTQVIITSEESHTNMNSFPCSLNHSHLFVSPSDLI